MKRTAVVFFLMMVVFALSFNHDPQILANPGEEITADISISSESMYEEGEFLVRCMSEALVDCDSSIKVGAEKSNVLGLKLKSEKVGIFPVTVWVGRERVEFEFVVSQQVPALVNQLERYNRTFAMLEEKYGRSPLIEKGQILVENGFSLYNRKDYAPINGILEDIGNTLNQYYSRVDLERETSEEPEPLGFALVPLGILAVFVLFYYGRKRGGVKEEHPSAREVGEMVEKEFGGVNHG